MYLQRKPSLWAALAGIGHIFGVLFLISIPFMLPGFIAGEPLIGFGTIGIIAVVDILISIGLSLVPMITIAVTSYHFDDDGIMVRSSLFARTEQRVPWEKVTALQHHQTLVEKWLGIHRYKVVAYGVQGTTVQLMGLRDGPVIMNLIARKMREHATLGALERGD